MRARFVLQGMKRSAYLSRGEIGHCESLSGFTMKSKSIFNVFVIGQTLRCSNRWVDTRSTVHDAKRPESRIAHPIVQMHTTHDSATIFRTSSLSKVVNRSFLLLLLPRSRSPLLFSSHSCHANPYWPTSSPLHFTASTSLSLPTSPPRM